MVAFKLVQGGGRKPYAFGGPKPTPTDAMITLGLMEHNEGDRKKGAMAMLREKLNLASEEDTAKINLRDHGGYYQKIRYMNY